MSYFKASSNFAIEAFISDNVTIMGPLEIIAACVLKVG